jgi:glycosyltransferase involved in cell wall biosynthesis
MSETARLPVAIDVTPLLGARAGIGVAVAESYAALRALDHGPELLPYALSIRARLARAEAPDGTRFVPLPARVLLRSWGHRDQPRIDRWLRPARVVHATNYLAPPSAHPTLVSVYDCSFVRYPELCTPEVRAFEPIVRRAITRGATVHTGSHFVAAEIAEIFGNELQAEGRLVVVPLGVPALGVASALPEATSARLNGAPFVLAIGTIEPRKNFPHLVGAFSELASRHRDLRLVIAGHDGPARPAVDRAVERLDVDARERVEILGSVSDGERRALLDHAAALAYPSIYEGFGFPILEAMTARVPVVAARAGSIPEVAGDAALLVEPTDEHGLAAALDRIIDDDSLRADLVARGEQRVRAFSWDATARGLNDVYLRLASSS